MRSVVILLFGLIAAMPAWAAAPQKFDARDPVDGSAMNGLRLPSVDGRAFLYLMCDSDNRNPVILLSQPHHIDGPTRPFRVRYQIDGGEIREHWFLVLQNGKSGNFYPRHTADYEERFGKAPPVFDRATRTMNQAYFDWYDNIFNTVVADLAFGRNALIEIDAADGTTHAYEFTTARLGETIGVLKDCYEAPQRSG